ncbi:MAG: cation:proton antiporter, partial [Acidobacteriota bacterium]
MQTVETILTLLGLTTLLAFLAHKAKVPYPIFLVIGGMGVAFVPGLPAVSLDPQLVFLFFLPPILYAAGYFTSWRDFRVNLPSITLLAVGLVVATTAAVAAVVVALVPGVPWPAALVLGAIVSPPDAVAATAIAQRVRLPRRIVTVLEGESLVNDATGLVLLKFASAAIVTGHLAVLPGIAEFAVMVVGGVAVGLALGWLFGQAQRYLDDEILMTTASLLVSFVTYIVAERVHVSGVLATVTAGVVQGRYVPRILSSRARIESTAVWQTFIFILNALVFVLIGLQLPVVLKTLDWPWPVVVDGIFATFGTMVLVRLAWMFPGAYLPRFLFPKYRARSPYPSWQALVVVGWAGMRGVVSLAAALSLPLVLADG